VDYTLRTDFPHLGPPSPEAYLAWFREICRATAEMIVHWMRVGFVHGVMNTDNMSILGLTIDYGPYGWIEDFDLDWTPNTTDAHGRRYRFGNQAGIGQWNLIMLANAIFPLINRQEPFREALAFYNDRFHQGWNDMMAAKLGLAAYRQATDVALIGELVALLQLAETDMTIFFRGLGGLSSEETGETGLPDQLLAAYYQPEQLTEDYQSKMAAWLRAYRLRLRQDGLGDEARRRRMNAVNPKFVLRNYLAQMAIDKAETGDFSLVEELLELLRKPYEEQPDQARFAARRPEWARHRPGCSMLSCSS
jgi:uncharacterized protein YdiU (UPF0061 family)